MLRPVGVCSTTTHRWESGSNVVDHEIAGGAGGASPLRATSTIAPELTPGPSDDVTAARIPQSPRASKGTRFATLGVPQPVASSHPGPALNPTELPATMLFPLVMSWKARR